ncbi:MAG: phenylalanine--tRNA ligase subunit beta [Fibrobacterota bacterium]|nr:MAG: phenylalanine--tRNA ligase subunit beta [Fibrobacterota bacterium]
MKASLNWLKRLVDLTETPSEIEAHLTAVGLEVEEWCAVHELPGVVVGEVRRCEKVEGTKLSQCVVWDGANELPLVCGAPNVRAGLKVALATVGCVLPGGLEIKPAKIRGMESQGMLCADDELGLGEGHEGILELDPALRAGESFSKATGIADVLFEINVTPNRPDGTGHLGLARELALRLGRPLRNPLEGVNLPAASGPATVPVSIEAGCGCTRYVGRSIRGVKDGTSPAWMQNLLRTVGLRSISALVDITNFVLLEIGQPLHAFDLAKLRGGRLDVRGAKAGETLTVLDGRNLTLQPGDLVIADAQGPQCLGGVMGGADSGVSATTTEIFLETARFVPASVRFLARRTQCASDSSYRFERGVDPFATRAVSDYATSLVLSICGGTSEDVQDLSTSEHPTGKSRVRLRNSRVASLLGMDVPTATVKQLLTGIGCREVATESDAVVWELPGWRPDIFGEADLVEEIARLVGYDNIPTAFPSFPVAAVRLPAKEKWTRRIRRAFASRGLAETLSMRLAAQADQDRLRLDPADPRAKLVALVNPLSDETACLPRLAVANLLKAAVRNARRQERSVRLFECGKVFGRDLPESFANHRTTGIGEASRLAGLVTGPWSDRSWTGTETDSDLWKAKGVLEGALLELGLVPAFAQGTKEPFLHDGRQARVSVAGRELGYFGEIHPLVQEDMGLKTPVHVWELDLDALVGLLDGASAAQSVRIGDFPGTSRELNAVVDRLRQASDVVDAVCALDVAKNELVESVKLVSVYEGAGVPQGHKAVLVRVSYRSADRTPTDTEVNAIQDGIRQGISSLAGFALK